MGGTTSPRYQKASGSTRAEYDGGPGDRGIAAGRASGWGKWTADDYTTEENETVLVGVMLEHREALENVEDVLAVPGVGFAHIGWADLAISLGHPPDPDHPEVAQAVETFREACLDADVPVRSAFLDVDAAEEALAEGYRVLRIGGETGAARTVLGERLDALREE